MKHLRRFGFAFCALSLGTGILLACGDDDAVDLAASDGGLDQSAPDVQTGVDVQQQDVSVPDTGSDAGPILDAQADVELLPVDAGDPDADAGELAAEFPARLAAQMCATSARCCFGDPNTAADASVDGGHYNQARCLLDYGLGVDQSTPNGADFAKLTFDQSKATECLARAQVLSCNSNSAEYKALIAACYATFTGTVAAGAACAVSRECQPGLFCNTSLDGGSCDAIRDAGAPCGDWSTNTALVQNTCSDGLSGSPPLYCNILSDAGTLSPANQWTCLNDVGLDASCLNDSWCAAGACAFQGPQASTCQDFLQLYTQDSCSSFVAP